jgi:hypothetical protein
MLSPMTCITLLVTHTMMRCTEAAKAQNSYIHTQFRNHPNHRGRPAVRCGCNDVEYVWGSPDAGRFTIISETVNVGLKVLG